MSSTDLVRTRDDKMIAGVAGGIARHFGIDVTLVRIAFVLGAIFLQFGWMVYAVLWLVLPQEGGGPTGLQSLMRQFDSNQSR